MTIRKGVIPSAGLGTRFLPITYAQPKEMIPVVKKPTIQYVVEELAQAGIKDILIITGRNKRAIEDHFDPNPDLRELLKEQGKTELLNELKSIDELDVRIFYTRQSKPTGLADAIYLARDFVDDENFVVALGDTIIHSENKDENNFLTRMMEVHEKYSANATISIEKINKEDTRKYGIIAGKPLEKLIWSITDVVEKPGPDKAPSQMAVSGRYVFNPILFQMIEKTEIGLANERQLTDAIKLLISQENQVFGMEMNDTEKRYDIGNPLSYILANIELTLKDPEFGPPVREFLKKLL
ncbi:MAG: UTP--glucose-1-phosphate uridylyltransferase [Candidatus Helarchaeales archaeon]